MIESAKVRLLALRKKPDIKQTPMDKSGPTFIMFRAVGALNAVTIPLFPANGDFGNFKPVLHRPVETARLCGK
jgi:hypothetical protein